MAAVFCVFLAAALAVLSIGSATRLAESLAIQLEKRNKEVLFKNLLLENEIEERIRAEESVGMLADELSSLDELELPEYPFRNKGPIIH